jgi:Xaa-Pro aminopeptidase
MTETNRRLRAMNASLVNLGADALLVTNETNVRYLSGFTGDSSYLLVTTDQTTILSDGRFDTQIAIDCPDLAAEIRPPTQTMPDLTQVVLNRSGAKRVAVESDHLSLATFRQLQASCGSIEFIETSGVVEAVRMIKDESEIELTRRAVQIAEQTMKAILSSLRPNDTEREVAYRIEAELRARGAEGCSFPPIVAVGAAGALPHYSPAEAKIDDSDTLLIDWGATYQGYASDLTRTFHRDDPPSGFSSAYEAVLQAQLAAIDRIAPGVPARDVDAAAREVLNQAGIGDAFLHSLGHGTGLEIHEGPRISGSSDHTLAAGMIVTVEPGVYFQDRFGIRIEDDVLVTESGCEVLSGLPKGLDDCRLIL